MVARTVSGSQAEEVDMAAKRQVARPAKTVAKLRKSTAASSVSHPRYPQWKVDLFRIGISERGRYGQISGRATRAPGA
jgi:hypothetical protein